MAVTDLTDSLPWWTRQGGPTGTPSATPQGGGAASAPTGGAPPGVDPMQWMQYLQQMFGPGGGPQSGANSANMPSANASNMNASVNGNGDFAVPPGPNNGPGPGNVGPANGFLTDHTQTPPNAAPPLTTGQNMFNRALLARGGGPPTPPQASPMPYGGPMAAADAAGPPRPPMANGGPTFPARPAGVSASGLPLQPGSLSPGALAQFGGGAPMPWRGPMAGDSPANIAAAGGGTPAVNPTQTGGAGGQLSASNPRFVQIDRPNMPANGGPYGRAGAPQMTALNLAGMFNRGQPGPNPNVPAANAQAVSAVNGPLARPDLAQRVPLANAPMPPTPPASIANQRVANAVRSPNWWQNL